MADYIVTKDGELLHYGVKGMKWGVRRADKLDKRAQVNRTMASMNSYAANESSGIISKINRINANYYQKRADKLTAKAARIREKQHDRDMTLYKKADTLKDRSKVYKGYGRYIDSYQAQRKAERILKKLGNEKIKALKYELDEPRRKAEIETRKRLDALNKRLNDLDKKWDERPEVHNLEDWYDYV